ncbi:uncharacterized protein LOC134248087 [Saccostrea cucullata]|uniref:uncharacterized protein LOC134248087 n=1 Tax=Saccostrea cuccullata TaxID=36930 RepID=UPI002ED5A846
MPPVMDPLDRAQVLLLCDLCQIAALQSHCELCQINLCKACVGEHLSDSSKRHKVVPYKHRKSTPNLNYPKCPNHTEKHCELYCKKCDIPVCSTCISSGKHHGHEFKDILQKPSFMKEIFKTDLKELEKRILPTYEEILSDLYSEKVKLEKHYEKLTSAVTKQGEDWHREINIIVNKQKSEIDEMKAKHMAAVNKQEKEIKQITSEVKQSIFDLKKLLDSNDVSVTSGYKSRNAEFRSLPPKVNVSLPSYSPHQINTEQLHQMFGSLSALSITTQEHGYTMKAPEAVSCPPVKPLLDEPELITTIDTGYSYLHSVTCLSDEEIWTCGNDKIMKLYNIQGKLLKSIQTKSGYRLRDIAVTRSGDLVYTEPITRTVNIVKNDQIQEVIRLQGWKPRYVCSTSSGDLLVTMDSDDDKQSKVVRYSGSTEKQSIQFDSEGKPLYSSSSYTKYISENKNLDICVTDSGASAVVVVNQAGKLRFRYTGHPSTTKGSFAPVGITTDSQSQILTSDSDNNCIHILDQDGQFLRYIDNCDLELPWGLRVDTRDNLFVIQFGSEKRILPTYEEISSDLYSEKAKLEKHYEKLASAVTKQGEDWHREINIIVNKLKSEIDEMKTKHLAAVNKQEKEIKQITSEVKQSIVDLRKLLDSNDVSLTSGYKSRNAEFRTLPPKVNVSLPSYSPHQINTEQLHQMFGTLSALSITTEERGYTMKTPEAVSCPPVKPLLDEPELITTIDTGYRELYSVTCLSDEEIWTCGEDKIMKLYNLHGKLLKSIQTKSGKISDDIAVTRSGDPVYTDPGTRTVNMVKNKQIQEVIRLQGWKPYTVCSSSSGDLLVTMDSDNDKQSKVVRYSGSTEKQTIQFDSEGKPLYSYSNIFSKYISENRNLDICVADCTAHAVVVVNQAGKLRFRYTGHSSTTKGSFDPLGITTDSQSQILTSDPDNYCVRILDQDGHFLRYIDNCDLQLPWGLCVDTRDNLFVTELNSGKVKKIKYM